MKFTIIKQSLFAFFMALAMVACQKSPVETLSNESTAATPDDINSIVAGSRGEGDPKTSYEYYLNNKVTREGTFSLSDTTLFFLVEGVPGEDGSLKLQIRAYTADSLLNQYGDSKGWHLTLLSDIESHLAEYAETSGAIKEYEQTGEVPEWYTDYVETYVEAKLPGSPKSIIAVLWQHLNASGIPVPTLPLVGLPAIPLLNNQVSSFVPFIAVGVHKVYDKSFYRRRLATFSGVFPNLQTINFNGPFAPLNDKASSWWSIGL